MAYIRGVDILGQSMQNALTNIGGAIGQHMLRNRSSDLINQIFNPPPTVNPIGNGFAPVPGMGAGIPIPSVASGPPPFAPQNAASLARLADIDPEGLKAAVTSYQMNKPSFFDLSAGQGRYQQPANGAPPFLVASQPQKESNDTQVVVKPRLMPNGKTHNFAVGLDKSTMKPVGEYDMGEAPASGGAGALAAKSMNPSDMEFYYQQYKTDGQIPNIGMGGAPVKVQMMKYFAQRAKEENLPGQAVAAQKAVYSTAKTGLAAVTRLSDTLTPNVNAANGFVDLVSKQLDSGYHPPTQSPIANEFYQWARGERLTGDPEYQKYKNYIYAAVREYAKVVSGASGSVQGLSDFASRDAQGILNVMQTPEAARAALETMKNDMSVMKNSWQDQKNNLRGEIQGQAQTPVPKAKNVGKFTIEQVQ